VRFAARCPLCAGRVTALTMVVLEENMRAHVVRCADRRDAAREREAAREAQGELFFVGARGEA
jgi:hypothetical protein